MTQAKKVVLDNNLESFSRTALAQMLKVIEGREV